ncbi:glycosyl transferase (plasmid) [Azospirillum argentinense]|uniref:Glycosyl transferase n=2 Tax=Azospirillum argentinense TaxID=2970906 RepID=A0A060DVG1_9PROT|nr:glycosyl transferase [Azospirillum argentinense]EZQ02291.1 glycosyl transferase [Azospirillum argentinense]
MYSLIIPVYKNEGSIPELIIEIDRLNQNLDYQLEAVFVVDGSPDNSYGELSSRLAQAAFRSTVICLSRNFGSFAAIRTGLAAATGPLFAVMAADLQEPPELVRDMFLTLRDEEVDVALGVRASREDPGLSTLFSSLFWAVYCRFIQHEMPRGGVDMFGCNQKVRDCLLALEESNSTLVGLLLWVGFKRREIPYHRRARKVGKSGWTFRRKFRYMTDSMFAFSSLPIITLNVFGFLGVVASVLIGGVILLFWALGLIDVSGYTPIMLSIMFFGALNIFGLGLLGSYIWRAFENTKRRPNYIEMSREHFLGGPPQ